MKVALLNDKLDAGGAEKVLVNMANLLHKNGVEVTVILFLQPAVLDHLIHPAIKIGYLQRKGRFDLKAMFRLKKMLHGVDIVHVHSRYNLRYYMVARIMASIHRPKLVFHEHVPVLSVDFFTKLMMQRTAAYVAVLQSMCSWAKETMKVAASRVFYLPNTITPPAINIEQQPAGYKIIMVGNCWHFKNQLFAIDLINSLPQNYTLEIYGAVNDVSYHEQILKKIESYDLQQRVKMVQGVSNIYEVLGNYNFAIHTSPSETGPLVLLEYMYAGLPFLSYKTGDVVDNITAQLPEVVLDTFNIENWKNAIVNIMMNDAVRQQIRTKMKAIIHNQYSEANFYTQLSGIYQSVLNC